MLLLAVALIQKGLLSVWLPIVSAVFPLLVLVTGLLLGWRFNRSRLVFALLMLGTADRLLVVYGVSASFLPNLPPYLCSGANSTRNPWATLDIPS